MGPAWVVTGSYIPISPTPPGDPAAPAKALVSKLQALGYGSEIGQANAGISQFQRTQTTSNSRAPEVPDRIRKLGKEATDKAIAAHGGDDYYSVGHKLDGTFKLSPPAEHLGGLSLRENRPGDPRDFDVIGHQHAPGRTSWSTRDKNTGDLVCLFKNREVHGQNRGYDVTYHHWYWQLSSKLEIVGGPILLSR
jgi:hypothetical protein